MKSRLTPIAATLVIATCMCHPTKAEETHPILSYTFEQEQSADDSGTQPFVLHNSAMIVSTEDGNKVLSTGNANGYLEMGAAVGEQILSKLTEDYSITLDLCVGASNALDRFSWAWAFSNGTGRYLGMVNAAGNGNWYYEIKDGTAQSTASHSGISKEAWHTITIVQRSDTCTFYLDGKAKGSQKLSLQPSNFASALTGNYIGRSPFSGDAYMNHMLADNFKVYDKALTEEQVIALYEARPQSQAVVMDIDNMIKTNREDLYLAKAATYIHQELKLPTACSYGTVKWVYQPFEGEGSDMITYEDGTFTVKRRSDETVAVGTLQGTIHYEGQQIPLYDEPLVVRVAPDDNAYGYIYCHMPNLVPETGVGTLVSQTITYALGKKEDKGLVFTELNRGSSIINGIGTKLPWCRDAFMAKDKKRECYYIVTTDLYGSLDNGTSMLWNYSIGMFRSFDMINWTYRRCDLKSYLTANPPKDIYDNSGTHLMTANKVSRVWAPQITFIDGDPYIYYAVGNTDNGDCDHFYLSKANEDFTGIESFQVLYDANKVNNVLDADLVFLETDSMWHMSYRDYEAGTIQDITTKDLLNPKWSQPVSSFSHVGGFEASSVFRRINEDVWNIGYVNYAGDLGYHFKTADAMLRNIQSSPSMQGHLSPQHGSFLHATETEYHLLQTWSDLKALITDAKKLSAKVNSEKLTAWIERAQKDITTNKKEATDLEALLSTLQTDKDGLRARFLYEKALYQARKANFSDHETRAGAVDNQYNEGKLTAAILEAEAFYDSDLVASLEQATTNLDTALKAFFIALENAGESIPVVNGTFNTDNAGWTVSGATGHNSGVAEFFALRAVDYRVSISQIVKELEEGYYLVKCQAFERNGENDHSGRDCNEKVELINYKMFANKDSVEVQSLYAIPYHGAGSWHGFANNMEAANNLFKADAGNYANYLLVYVRNRRINFGITRNLSTVNSSDWCCFDNFEIYSLGKATDAKTVKADHDLGKQAIYDLTGVYYGDTTDNGSLPPSLPKGIYVVNKHKMVKD